MQWGDLAKSKKESSCNGQGIWQQGFNCGNGIEMEETEVAGGDMENLVTRWRLQERKNNKVMLLTEAKDTVVKSFWNKN